jgi:nitroimidazol reductase NimA-like FMN-containing flavoprotein (pyridoxamine 5'-phosphate oxidase superfamily)
MRIILSHWDGFEMRRCTSNSSRDGFPHTVPLGYFRQGGDILMGVRDGTQKVANVERNPKVSAMLESGSTMADIRGVLIQGTARVHRDAGEVLALMREAATFRGIAEGELPTEARATSVYIRLVPEHVVSWDYS